MAVRDDIGDESFRRVLGKRRRSPLYEVPSAPVRRALADHARYATGAPKGFF